jgi:hypothetical protein
MTSSLLRLLVVVPVALCAAQPAAAARVEGERAGSAFESFSLLPSAARLALDAPATAHGQTRLVPLAQLERRGLGAPDVSNDLPLRRVTVQEESRVFWYAAGASAITSVGARVLLVVPGLFALGLAGASSALLGPVGTFMLLVGLATGFVVGDAALSALAASLVYDNVSRFYSSRYLPTFAGHLLGNVLSVGATSLMIGFGGMLLFGLESLSAFAGPGAFQAILVFTTLGVMPAFVVAFLASVAVPAVIGTWALAASASPRAGFVIEPGWRPLGLLPPPRTRDDERLPMFASIAIPST